MAVLDPVQRRADAESAVQRLEQERHDITSRLFDLAQALTAAEERVAKAEAKVVRVGSALAGEMETGASLGRTCAALREQFAAAQLEQVDARSDLDRLVREDGECRRRLDQIATDILSWDVRRDYKG